MVEIVFDDDGALLPLVLDAVPSEDHRATAVATSHEVERGVDIADHVRAERRLLTLDVRVSDTPVYENKAIGLGLETFELDQPKHLVTEGQPRYANGSWVAPKLREQAAEPVRVATWQPTAEVTRVVDAWAILMDARERALLATITTAFETYENMVLTEVSATRAAEDSSWLRASLSFAELRMVATQFVDDPRPSRPRDRKPVEQGSQEPVEMPPEQLTSLLRQYGGQVLQGLKNFVGL